MKASYKATSIAALVVGVVLAGSHTSIGASLAGGASAFRSSVNTTTLVEQAVVVVRRGGVAAVRRPAVRCVWVRGRRVCS
jgi:hypothetical protein